MVDQSQEVLFRQWNHRDQSPQRLLENFASRIHLQKSDVEIILDIMDYAVWQQERKKKDHGI